MRFSRLLTILEINTRMMPTKNPVQAITIPATQVICCQFSAITASLIAQLPIVSAF